MFAEQLWGNNRRKKWPVGVNPAGHPCCITPSSGSKDVTVGAGEGRASESEEKLCSLGTTSYVLQTWAKERPA